MVAADPEIAYLFDSGVAAPKAQLAQHQIEGAIRAHLSGQNAIVIHTLLAPASQILRDLNRENERSIAKILGELAVEAGYSSAAFWREFNDKSANYLKHATRKDDVPPIGKMNDSVVGAICFCAWEYSVQNGGRLPPVMHAFITNYVPKQKRTLRWLRTRIAILCYDIHLALAVQFMRWLLRLQQNLGAPTI